jgi:hypothetical protein
VLPALTQIHMEETTKTKAKANSDVAELQAIIEEQSARIKQLEGQLAALKPQQKSAGVAPPKETFKVGKQEYAFKVALIIHPDWGRVTASEALKNKVLLEDLVLRRSGAIKKV